MRKTALSSITGRAVCGNHKVLSHSTPLARFIVQREAEEGFDII